MKSTKAAVGAGEKKPMSMWAVILIVVTAVYILSFVIPAGSFEREGNTAIPGTFAITDKIYLTPFQVIMGIGDAAFDSFGGLFISILIIGGMMGVVNSTGIIDTALGNMIHRLRDKALLIIPCFIFAMGFLGALGSMISTAILFLPLGLSLAKQMRVDRKFAVALIMMGSYTGFMSSPVNTLTTVLGQEIAGLEPYSGFGLRLAATVTNLTLVSVYLMWYARKTSKTNLWREEFKADAEGGADGSSHAGPDGEEGGGERRKLTGRDAVVLCLFFGGFIFFAIGAPLFHFTTLNLGSIMLPIGLLCGFAAGYDLDRTMKNFVKGAQSMVSVLIFMILASAMSVILNDSQILDTIVYYFSIPLNYLGSAAAAIGMFVANAVINIFINSGSGQTAVVMPIMAPLSDVVGVTRQMAVMTLQFGDGFTNLLAPTSVNLLANLALARVSMRDWYRIAVPIHAIEFVFMCGWIILGTAIGF